MGTPGFYFTLLYAGVNTTTLGVAGVYLNHFTYWGLVLHAFFGLLLFSLRLLAPRWPLLRDIEKEVLFWGAPLVGGLAFTILMTITTLFNVDEAILSRLNPGVTLSTMNNVHFVIHVLPLFMLCGVLMARIEVLHEVFSSRYVAIGIGTVSPGQRFCYTGIFSVIHLIVLPCVPLLLYGSLFNYHIEYKTDASQGVVFGTAVISLFLFNMLLLATVLKYTSLELREAPETRVPISGAVMRRYKQWGILMNWRCLCCRN